MSLGRELVKLSLIRVRKPSDLGSTANGEVHVRVLQSVVCCSQVFTTVNLFASVGIQIQLVQRLPERIRRDQVVMACLATLISNGAALLLAVGVNTCLLSPSVTKRSRRKADQPSYRDAAKDSTEGEPSARIVHGTSQASTHRQGFGGFK